ncbi:MDH2 [Symbiodinium sp. CCMP2456]|nr:MDH2 [Symbiodinium sp. CCMP2456]
MAEQLAERSHTSKCTSAFALTEELRAIARDLRDASNLPNEEKQAALHKSAKQLDDAADAVGNMVKQLELRSGGSLPTHFVGVRMPVHVRRRLGHLQSEMLKRDARLQKAAVSMEKSHVTLLVARLAFDDISKAAEALQHGAEAWRSERHGAVQVRAEGLGHFPQNGVLYTRLLPRDVFDSLRKHLMQAFAERGLTLVDEMPDEAVANADASAKSGDAPPAAAEVAVASPKEGQEKEKEAREEDSAESEHEEYLPHVTLFKSSQAGRGKSGQQAAKAAKQSIARVAKSLLGEGTEKIAFGSFSLEDCELLAMHHVQGDGYFEAQASAKLRESSGEDAASPGEEDEEEFHKEARQILERIPAAESDQKSPKKRKAKKKQTKKTNQKDLDSEEEQADAESEDSEGDTSAEEAPAKKSSAAKRGKLRKAAAAAKAVCSVRVLLKKKKAAPARPPSEDEEEEDDAADGLGGQSQEDQRIDPEDGLAYTWSEFSEYYTGKYKKKVIEAYWNDCHLVPKKEVPQPKAARKKARRRWFSRR